jgi:hypothetical protein
MTIGDSNDKDDRGDDEVKLPATTACGHESPLLQDDSVDDHTQCRGTEAAAAYHASGT